VRRFTEFRALFVEANTEQAIRCKTRANTKSPVGTGGMDAAT